MDGLTLGFSLLGAIGDGSGQTIGQAILALQADVFASAVILAALSLALFAVLCVRERAPSFLSFASFPSFAERSDATMRQRVWAQLRADEDATAGRIGRNVGQEGAE